jgi:hypothetical protein
MATEHDVDPVHHLAECTVALCVRDYFWSGDPFYLSEGVRESIRLGLGLSPEFLTPLLPLLVEALKQAAVPSKREQQLALRHQQREEEYAQHKKRKKQLTQLERARLEVERQALESLREKVRAHDIRSGPLQLVRTLAVHVGVAVLGYAQRREPFPNPLVQMLPLMGESLQLKQGRPSEYERVRQVRILEALYERLERQKKPGEKIALLTQPTAKGGKTAKMQWSVISKPDDLVELVAKEHGISVGSLKRMMRDYPKLSVENASQIQPAA